MPQRRVPKLITGYGKSYALLSHAPSVDTAVIFVHGFGGKPTSTWRNFHLLVDEYSPEYSWWSTSDLFFYAYESLGTPIRRNASRLGVFVESIWRSDWKPKTKSDDSRKYKDLILAGHSEGGVIIRRLVLDRYETMKKSVEEANPSVEPVTLESELKKALSADYLLAAYLRLFAPACRGTNFSSLIGFLTALSRLVYAVSVSPLVRNELLHDSPVLSTLQAGTEQAHARFREIRSLYTRPIFGVPDQIVYSESYQGEEPLWDEGYDHFSVCKPSYTHKLPLEFVRK
jgi:hypothetical protein